MKMLLHLRQGDTMDQRDILRRLAELQYKRNDIAFERGSFRVRGDVNCHLSTDSEKQAIRVELFDAEIEKISYFDPLTGEVDKSVARATIVSKTHYVTPRERILNAVENIKDELELRREQLKEANKLLEEQRISQRTQFDIEMMLELGFVRRLKITHGICLGEPLLSHRPR